MTRCLCDRHSPHLKDHGGPCCGVAGGKCIACRYNALVEAARAVMDARRAEAVCCEDCEAVGKEPWWTDAEETLWRLLIDPHGLRSSLPHQD